MSGFREAFLPLAQRIRGLADVGIWDVRPNGVTVRVRTWPGQPGASGDTPVDVDTEIVPRPKIREVSSREVSGSGGLYEQGDLRIGPITPAFDTPREGGYTGDQLTPRATAAGIELIYVIEGPNAGEYALVDSRRDRAFQYSLVVRRKNTTP